MFGVMLQLYSRDPETQNEPPRLRLHSEIFDTEAKAENYIDECRRQNLPFKGKWIIKFDDPRESKL